MRHGTCFRRRLSASHAGAAPHSAVAELGVVRRLHTLPVNTISKTLVFAVTYIAGAPTESDEREDADVEALEYIGFLLRDAQPSELAALRASVDEAIAAEKRSETPDPARIQNYEAFIESYLSP